MFKTWIRAGATWPDSLAGKVKGADHWAFKAPVRPELPVVKDARWAQGAVDRFVLARLEQEQLAPSPEADRVTLLRRLSLDLVGLPPTVEELDAFLADQSPDAWSKAVERLLASPHYGERWGRWWLDGARYADSDGFEKDKPRNVWMYREWVMNAFNRDLPYNQFVLEQIAGDLLPRATQDQIVATGFLRNSMINEEGGVDPEQFRMEAMFDRMDAIGKSVLGLTLACCQCHSHKYDPITQTDYYRMFAYLNNSYEGSVAVYNPDELLRRNAILEDIRAIEDHLREARPDWPEAMAAWEDSVTADQPEWTTLRPADDSSGGEKHYNLPDGSILSAGYAPTKSTLVFPIETPLEGITAVQLELLNDPNLPRQGPGRSSAGLCVLSEFQLTAASAKEPGKSQPVKVVAAYSDAEQPERPLEDQFFDKSKDTRITGPAAFAIDGKNETGWGINMGNGRSNVPRRAVFIFEKPVGAQGPSILTFKLVMNHGGWNSDDNQSNNLGRFRLSVTTRPNVAADPVPEQVRKVFATPRAERSPAQVRTVFSYWRTLQPEWKAENDRIEALWATHPAGSSQLVLQERQEMRTTSLLKRGDFLKPVNAVEPGVPAVLNQLPEGTAADRVTLGKWLADRQSPTTARALVNRVWQAYFGTGIVASSEDLGTQCDPPSHPDLLDWLAVEFMESGWSLKHLHRLIVQSATYRQSSRVDEKLLALDPYNRLLARGPRFRVDAEVVRDIALTASGLLNRKFGGPSVYPPLPEFMLLPPVSYGPKTWREDKGENRYRRAVYTFRFRSLPYPVLQTFDSPNGDFACVKRPRSNTPLQALMTLNEPIFMECAQALAATTLSQGGTTDTDRLRFAFRRCVSRTPSDEELAVLTTLLDAERSRLAGKADLKARPPLGEGRPAFPEGTSTAEQTAWTLVARVLLNLDETITRE